VKGLGREDTNETYVSEVKERSSLGLSGMVNSLCNDRGRGPHCKRLRRCRDMGQKNSMILGLGGRARHLVTNRWA
jgi:hypothetical protein